jgi:DNA-binding NtrC family response regulator
VSYDTCSIAAPVLTGRSPRMAEVRRLIDKAGKSRSPVLLLGETGTGKEVVARAIHCTEGSGPFVPIDCSLLGTLLETELFGHARGAFTGAVINKTGLLEAAEGGTAFFDEVAECPLDMQAKLLRVLQDKEIRPVGSLARRRADFRTIAATNRDLAAEVEGGRFRRDLYYRLNVITLRLPPLRDRKEDVPELAQHFLRRHGAGQRVTPELLDAFLGYDWPGNVRELEGCIQRLVALNSGPELQARDLPTALAGALQARGDGFLPVLGSHQSREQAPRPALLSLRDAERQAILRALDHTAGDRGRAADLLGIGRTTLYRRLKEYGL